MTPGKYRLPSVDFDSPLVQLIVDLERLRGNLGYGTTRTELLGELHALFQLMSSVISARIEGNRTTIFDAIRDANATTGGASEQQREITNLLGAIAFIESTPPDQPLTHVFVRELHRLTVEELTREGDERPGSYRNVDVQISRASHIPPSHVLLQAEMDEFLDFANREVPTSQQMIHVALAHHRFLWIHPFRNGNGRVSRLLSYAMIRRNGFVSPIGFRTVNPTAVFGNDRDDYYAALESADSLSNEGTVAWCTFFARGIHSDLERLTKLQSADYLFDELLDPTLGRMQERGVISAAERGALKTALVRGVVKAGDLADSLPGSASHRSQEIRGMLSRGLLEVDRRGPRFYRVPLLGDVFAPHLIAQLDALGFLPPLLKEGIEL